MGRARIVDQVAAADVAPTARRRAGASVQAGSAPRVVDGGLAVTPVPDLMADWRDKTVEAAIYEAASVKLFGVAPDQLDDEQTAQLDSRFAALHPALAHQLADTDAKRQRLVDTAARSYRPAVAALRDPFSRIAQGPRPYPGERLLWENASLMVIADVFIEKRGGGPKILVIPKRKLALPTDAPAALLQSLAKVAAAAGDALAQAGGSARPADVWINPPQHLMVGQLHVHVQPHLTPWKARGLGPRQTQQAITTFYAEVEKLLAQRLGPSA